MDIEAVVFYRVFNLPPAAGTCRIYVAVPVQTEMSQVPQKEGGFQLVLQGRHDPSAALREVSDVSSDAAEFVIPGEVVTVRGDVAFFEPSFSPIEIDGALCSELKMEEGRVKYLRLALIEREDAEQVKVTSARLVNVNDGQPIFMK